GFVEMPSSPTAPSEGVVDSVTNFPWWTLLLVFGITKLISGTTGRRVARRVARMLGKDTQAPPKLEGRRPRVPSSASSDASETSSACSDGEINGEELKMVIAVRMDLQMGKGK
ncbi:Gluconate transport-inducing protein, partial [Perkinsus olseni]